MPSYCTLAQFGKFGLAQTRWAGRETIVSAQLDGASGDVDGYLRTAAFKLPLTAWGDDLSKAVAEAATLGVLTVIGFNPENGSDQLLVDRANKAMDRIKSIAGPVGNRWIPNVTDSSSAGWPFTPPLPVGDDAAGY